MIFDIIATTDKGSVFQPIDPELTYDYAQVLYETYGIGTGIYIRCWDGYENAIEILK